MQKLPKVSIVTVNFNQPEVTYELLKTLNQITYTNIEVWVVDNGSTQKVELSNSSYTFKVNYIYSEHNLGFAGGNNLAISKIDADYVLLLNNDIEVPSDFLEPLVHFMEEKSSIGIVSPKIKFYHGNQLIQFAGFSPINPYTSRGFALGSQQKDDGRFDKALSIPRAHGAAMLIKKSLIQKIGMLPELYFLYYEEMDYCKSALEAGFEIWYVPEAYVLHKESISTGKDSPLKTYYLNRNRLLYIRRNEKGITKAIGILYFICFAWMLANLKFIMKGKLAHLKSNINALLWHFKSI